MRCCWGSCWRWRVRPARRFGLGSGSGLRRFILGRPTWFLLRLALMVITGMRLMSARRTATTVLTTSSAACSSAPVRGSMATMADAAIMAGGTGLMAEVVPTGMKGSAAKGSVAKDSEEKASAVALQCTGVAASIVSRRNGAGAHSTGVAVSMAGAATAAATGKRCATLQKRTTAGSHGCQPFFCSTATLHPEPLRRARCAGLGIAATSIATADAYKTAQRRVAVLQNRKLSAWHLRRDNDSISVTEFDRFLAASKTF